MKLWLKKLTDLAYRAIVLAVCFSLLMMSPCLAQTTGTTKQFPILSPHPKPPVESLQEPIPPSSSVGLTNPQELETFLDSFVPEQMEKQHTLGGAIAVVKDGKLFFAKGYGYADADQKTPVVADQTVFRVASLSKLFTDTAIMQLYEKNLLDLNTDVNQYLPSFKLDYNYPQPITLDHLMTQTDGTSQRLLGIAASRAEQLLPLEKFIPNAMPPLIYPPGEIYSYSNLGITLTGYIVETTSQMPFAQYINQNILQPLKMQHSTFEQPLPEPLADALTAGYFYKNGQFKPYPFLHLNVAPAAAFSTTVTDLAHFAIAHLQQGRYETGRILQPQTTQLMHRQHFTHHPQLAGTAYGFHERLENNLRAIGHAGNMPGYSSSLTLIPSENIGLIIALNCHTPSVVRQIISRFLDHYYPVAESSGVESAQNIDLKRFRGTYRDLEYPHDTLAKLTAPFGHVHIEVNPDNTLTIKTPGLYFPTKTLQKQLTPVSPLLFKRQDDNAYTAFAEDAQGRIEYIFNPVNAKIGAFKKVPWYETVVFQLWWAGICGVLLLSACFISPLAHWLNGASHPKASPRKITRYAHLNAILVGSFYLISLLGSGLFLWMIGVWKLAYGIPAIVKALFYLIPIATGLTLGLVFFSVLAWKKGYWSRGARIHYILVTLAALAFIPFLYHWNLLTL